MDGVLVERSAVSLGGMGARSAKSALRQGQDALLRARLGAPSYAASASIMPASAAEELLRIALSRENVVLPEDVDEDAADTTSVAQQLLLNKGRFLRIGKAASIEDDGPKDELPFKACLEAAAALADFDSITGDGDDTEEDGGDGQPAGSGSGAGGHAAQEGGAGKQSQQGRRKMMSQMCKVHQSGGVLEDKEDDPKAGATAEGQLCKQLKEALKDNKPPDVKEAFKSCIDDNTVAAGVASLKEGFNEGMDAAKDAMNEQLSAAKEQFASVFGGVFGGGGGGSSSGSRPSSAAAGGKLSPSTTGSGSREPVLKRVKKLPQQPKAPEMGVFSWLDNGLSPKQLRLRRKARTFAISHILPHVSKWEESGSLPRRMMRQAGKEGFCAMYCSRIAGGEGMKFADVAVAFEAIGPAGLQAASLLAHQNMVSHMMDMTAPLALRLTLTRALASGLAVGGYGIDEVLATWEAPDKTMSFATLFKDQSGDYYVLNGLKTDVTLAGSADVYLVALRTETGINFFVLPKVYPGVFAIGDEDAAPGGLCPARKLVMTMCMVRQEMLCGDAVKAVTTAMDGYRLCLAASAVGAAQVAVDFAVEYLATRPTQVLDFQGLQEKLVQLQASAASARMLVRRAAHSLDTKASTKAADCALAKLCCVRTAMDVASQAMNLLGGAALTEFGEVLYKLQKDLTMYTMLGGNSEDSLTATVFKSLAVQVGGTKHAAAAGDKGEEGEQGSFNQEGAAKLLGDAMSLMPF